VTPPAAPTSVPGSVDDVVQALAGESYVADRRLATVVLLALSLKRPLFVEGEPGVGKTELAKALARALGAQLLRVQCYEGLDVAQTSYEWNVARQMMEIRLAEAAHDVDRARLARSLYGREMLIERPLLQALTLPGPPVLPELPGRSASAREMLLAGSSEPATAQPRVSMSRRLTSSRYHCANFSSGGGGSAMGFSSSRSCCSCEIFLLANMRSST